MPDVTIPADVAKAIADDLRRITAPSNDEARLSRKAWADLLDPQPPTLREQVARLIANEGDGDDKFIDDWRGAADAVLTVVADWLAAQPMPYPDVVTRGQRDHDVRLLRGGSDG